MLPLALVLRRRPPAIAPPASAAGPARPLAGSMPARPLGFSPAALQGLLCVAGVACCVAMSMPQVHIVAYCGDLGFGAARGAEMLSLMLGFGIVSRLVSGWIADHIGGLRTLLLGSLLQGVALLLFLPFDGLASLYVVSALFGLFQGGIVPAYTLIVREYFTPEEAGARVGTVLMATLFGMALGGWMSGRDLRCHRLLPRRVPERHRLEPAQRRRRRLPALCGRGAGAGRRSPPPRDRPRAFVGRQRPFGRLRGRRAGVPGAGIGTLGA